MTGSVLVSYRDVNKAYPRCAYIDEHGACQIGAGYVVPTGPVANASAWQWTCLCAVHYLAWMNNGGHRYPGTPSFRLSPVTSPRRKAGSVPR